VTFEAIPAVRVRRVNDRPVEREADYVLYWMIAARRVTHNFGLEHAAWWARQLDRPLVILEALRCDYPWASTRLHRFILDGMWDTRSRLRDRAITYHPYVETEAGHGRGLLAAAAERACLVITDDYPTFFLPRMVAAAGERLEVRLEAVDGNGLLPMADADKDFPTAYAFRRHLQKRLPSHLQRFPLSDPLGELPSPRPLPEAVTDRWPAADDELLTPGAPLDHLPLDGEVAPVEGVEGGTTEAEKRMNAFLDDRLARYADDRNRPEDDVPSGLSPWLHFGHLSSHQVVGEILDRERWSTDNIPPKANGSRQGWWGLSPSAEGFLDQIITWRELGFNVCRFRDDHDRFSSLPPWARATLEDHADDPREYTYTMEEFERAETHDPLWNAAQNQLRREGYIHNYLRMLWGKKILEWSPSPEAALHTMVHLNNRWALDGRDPNSYSGIFWVLGRHDRPWGPERPIFGKIRYMSSDNTARKVPVKGYIERYSQP
jgi:deoxyribodipyrimidine photo-lyase